MTYLDEIIIRCCGCGKALATIEYRPSIQSILCSKCDITTTAYIKGNRPPYEVWTDEVSGENFRAYFKQNNQSNSFDNNYLSKWLSTFTESFSYSEIRDEVCFNMGIDFDQFPNEGKTAKAVAIINYFNRRNELEKLITYAQQERPNVRWPQ